MKQTQMDQTKKLQRILQVGNLGLRRSTPSQRPRPGRFPAEGTEKGLGLLDGSSLGCGLSFGSNLGL